MSRWEGLRMLHGHDNVLRRRRRLARENATAALSMSTRNPPPSSTQQHAPFPFPNTLATMNAMASSWSPFSAAMSSSSHAKEECALPPDTRGNFGRYSKFLVKNSNGVDGMGGGRPGGEGERREALYWVDTLGDDECEGHRWQLDGDRPASDPDVARPRPFSILSWNVLAQSLYEKQCQRRRVQQVALSSHAAPRSRLPPSVSSLASATTSPHPHPWPKRAKRILEILGHYKADIICLQECEAHSFRTDVLPALSQLGYDGIAQEDGRSDDEKPMRTKEETKHRSPRNHIVATLWKRDKFEPVGDALVRTRSLTTVLRLKSDDDDLLDDDGDKEGKERENATTPMVAVVNVHLEGHPRRFSERTNQLLHAMKDLAKRIEHERGAKPNPAKLNALLLAGDFNCELQSSACSTYLRMGRLGRQAGLGGVHGEDALALPPPLLETAECAEVIQPVVEWGRALPEEILADVDPHPFRRRNGMTSAYPPWLGRDDAREHFTFCSELSKQPVPGLDQLWFSSMTLERRALMRHFVDDSALWERYFYDDAEVEQRREDERRRVLASGLPSLDGRYPSDHLPIGAIFDWNWDDCAESCLLDDGDEERREDCTVGVRGLNVIDSEGNNIQEDRFLDPRQQRKREMQQLSFETPHEELDYLLRSCPFDSEQQRSDVRFILSPLDPPLCITSKERPTPGQMEQLEARREKKAELLTHASLGMRPWLKDIWKASKQVGKWDRQQEVKKMRLLAKGKC